MSLRCLGSISKTISWGLFIGLLSQPLQARVFDISKQSIGTFLRGTYANSSVGKRAYQYSSGASTEFSDSVAVNTSGEFGVYMGGGPLGFRFSVELMNPKRQKDIVGADSGGTSLMTLDSKIDVLIYKATFEYSWFLSPASKLYLSLGAGSSNVTLTNIYTMTAAGTSAYPSVSDHTEKGTQTLIMGEVALGYEYNFSADTTLLFDLGWRQMQAKALTHTSDTTSFLGNVSAGDPLKDTSSSGPNRTLDLGGFYVGLGFRFYINY